MNYYVYSDFYHFRVFIIAVQDVAFGYSYILK